MNENELVREKEIEEQEKAPENQQTGESLATDSEFVCPLVQADCLYRQMVTSLNVFSTGCSNLDTILGGGLYSGELTEICGEAGIGKTQSCLSIATHIAGKLQKHVVYIDAGGGFSCERLHEIMMSTFAGNVNIVEHAMARIKVIKTFQIQHTFFVLDKLMESLSAEEFYTITTISICAWQLELLLQQYSQDILCSQNDDDTQSVFNYNNVELVILDSVASLMALMSENKLGYTIVRLSRQLKSLAYEFNIAVLLANNVTFEYALDGESHVMKPSLGLAWSHAPNNRILLQRANESLGRSMKLIKSSRKPLSNMALPFSITKAGLTDGVGT